MIRVGTIFAFSASTACEISSRSSALIREAGSLDVVNVHPVFTGQTPKNSAVVMVVPSPTSRMMGSSLDPPLGYLSEYRRGGEGGMGRVWIRLEGEAGV